jgi:hypothetical protein
VYSGAEQTAQRSRVFPEIMLRRCTWGADRLFWLFLRFTVQPGTGTAGNGWGHAVETGRWEAKMLPTGEIFRSSGAPDRVDFCPGLFSASIGLSLSAFFPLLIFS